MPTQPPECATATIPITAQQRLDRLAARGATCRFKRGSLLIQENDLSQTLYILQKGKLRVFVSDAQGKELTLGTCLPGDYVGEMSLDGAPRSASVEALEPSTCAMVSRQLLLDYLREEPEFALDLMARVIRRARTATQSARNVALMDVYSRLVLLLQDMAGPLQSDGSRTIAQRITHQQLAQHLACSREMVSRLLKDLERGGYVRLEKGLLVLARGLPAHW